MKYDLERIKQLPMAEVAEKYGSGLRRVGAQLVMLCPWHDDHHPSLSVSPKKGNSCRCWACGNGGSVIDLVMAEKGCGFQEACETLGRDFGLTPALSEREGVGCRVTKRSTSNHTSSSNHAHALPLRGMGGFAQSVIDRAAAGRKRMKEWEEENLARRVYIPNEYYAPFVSSENSFCKALRHLFLPEGIKLVTEDYQLGCYDKLGNADDVMFPSIDMEGRIHNIKIQHYCTDKNNERFLHADRDHMFWLGSLLKKQGMFPQDAVLDCTCFFGEHLLAKYPSTTVVLVESPKNAVVGRLEHSDLTWIAAGNKNNLTTKRLECLRGRNVIVIPDNDAMDEWKKKIDEAKHIANFHFSSFCTTKLKDMGEKGDVADYIISKEWI